MDLGKEFRDYAIKHMGVSKADFQSWEDVQNRIYGPSASMTPYIIEERPMQITQLDIFSRMMMDRIIWCAGVVNDRMSTIVQAQLMFLDTLDNNRDITLHIDTPGGSVKSGLSMIDVMEYVASDIITVNTGMAASMGSVLLGAGTKGKRYSLKSSKVMLHQVSSGASGNIQDIRISLEESEKANKDLFRRLGEYTNKTADEVMHDAQRDLWLSAEEAVAYGIIDGVHSKAKEIKKKK